MHGLLSPDALSARVREFVAAEAAGERLDGRVAPALEHAVLFGQVPRAALPGLLGVGDRQARRLMRPLVARGLLHGSKDAPLRIAFPWARPSGCSRISGRRPGWRCGTIRSWRRPSARRDRAERVPRLHPAGGPGMFRPPPHRAVTGRSARSS